MAQSVPREVIERALRNNPRPGFTPPKFGTMAWRSISVAGSTAITIAQPALPENVLLYEGEPLTYEGEYITYS